MRLPQVPMGGVQSLGRENISQKVATAVAPYEMGMELISSAYESREHYELMRDQESALEEANRAAAVNGVLRSLKDEQVDLNGLPPQVVENYRLSDEYDETKHGVFGDSEKAPAHLVAQSVYDWANTQLKEGNERLRSGQAQTLYNDNIGDDIQSAFEDASAGIRASQISTLRVQNDISINNAAGVGSTKEALRMADNGLHAGLYSTEQHTKRKNDIYKVRSELYNEDQNTLQTDIYNATFSGNPDLVKQRAAEYEAGAAAVMEFGTNVLTPDKHNEYTRAFNKAAYGGTVDGNAQRIATGDDVASALAWVEAQEAQLSRGDFSDLPEGMDVGDAQKVLSSSRARVQERHNALNKAKDSLKGQLELQTKITAIDNVIATNGFIPPRGSAYTDFSDVYAFQRNTMENNNADWTEMAEVTVTTMKRGKQLPRHLKDVFDSVERQTPEKQLQIAREYAYYKQMTPEYMDLYSGASKSYLEAASSNIRYGLPEANSEAMIDQLNTRMVTKREDYEANIATLKNNGEFKAKALDKVFEETTDKYNPWFSSNPDVAIEVRRATDYIYKHERARGFDHDAALATTQATINGRFGVDKTDQRYPNGRLTIMPPSQVYGDWTDDQFEELKRKQFPELDASKLFLETDGLTMYQEEPSWKVMYAEEGATPYQVTSWDKGGVDRGVITGSSGARWRPKFSDTQSYKDAKQEQAVQLSDAQFIKNQQSSIHDLMLTELRNSGLQRGTSEEEVQLSVTDSYQVYRDAVTEMADSGRFGTDASFDRKAFDKATREVQKAATTAQQQYRYEMGFDVNEKAAPELYEKQRSERYDKSVKEAYKKKRAKAEKDNAARAKERKAETEAKAKSKAKVSI